MEDHLVGVRELQARLSAYLRRVKDGETIVITEWGRPIGRIVPEGGGSLSLNEQMQRLIDAGLAEWNGESPPAVEPVTLQRTDVSIADLIAEMRE